MGSPRPVPWLSREMNGTKMRSSSSGRCRAGIGDVDVDEAVLGRGTSRRAAVGRPAKGVREQIADHLQDAVSVGDDRRRLRLTREPEVDLAPPSLLAEARVGLLDEPPISTSWAWTVNRCALSFARSSTSPTRRSRRIVSRGNDVERLALELRIVEETVAQGVDVPLDRRQRRAELVRDRHQELPLALLGRREACRHVVESPREVADLVPAPARGTRTA